jgi:hypothetical protein
MRLFLATGEYPADDLFAAVRALFRSCVMAAIVREDYDEAAILKEAKIKLSADGIKEHKIKLQSIEERIDRNPGKLAAENGGI